MDVVVEHSRQLIEKGSKSFAGAARLFDNETRESAYMLYAWCRHCDDEIDDQDLGFNRPEHSTVPQRERLARLEAKTRAAIAGEASDPVFEALARVTAKHQIPARYPLELIEGFRMDVEGRHYATAQDTLTYCYHVAGVVGVMMAMIMGVRDAANLNRASDLGIAFQLTNIARDVVADAQAGRVYLPADWLAEAGLTAADIADPSRREAVFAVAKRLLDEADRYYHSARYGLPALPVRAALAIAAARRIYRQIGFLVRKRGPHAWDTRTGVSNRGKMVQAALSSFSIGRAHASRAVKPPPTRDGLWTMPGLGTS
jgi:15-cis-phytoene synthase